MIVKVPLILLCDLTYTQQTIASEVMPAAVGSLAAYLLEYTNKPLDIEIYKYPQKLIEDLERWHNKRPVQIVGFSNYVWNLNLSLVFAGVIKRHSPETIIVFGGPNFPDDPDEQEAFLRKYPVIDFHVIKEGEAALCNLVTQLIANNFDKTDIPPGLKNIAYINENSFFSQSSEVERIMDLSTIPSPYTTGILDSFFDDSLQPIVQTVRGCPFQCSYCTEGKRYWTKVRTLSQDRISEELDYIAKKMTADGSHSRTDLFIADSNFGMFPSDVETAKKIRRIQDKYNFPW